MPRLTLKLHGVGRPIVIHRDVDSVDPQLMTEAIEAAVAVARRETPTARLGRMVRESTRLGEDARREPDDA